MNVLNYLTNMIGIRDILDIAIISIVTYNCLKLLRGTRAEQLAKGILVILILTKLSEWGQFYTTYWLLNKLMIWGSVAIFIVFQPELRKVLEALGRRSSLRSSLYTGQEKSAVVEELVDAVASLARQKIGALIIIQRQTGLNEIIETGTKIEGLVSSGLLINIFIPNTPLHDGAVIIKGDKVVSAACFLPLSDSQNISKDLGTRHRAGIGISERSDCLSIMVSEETGSISTAENGVLSRYLDLATLEDKLNRVYMPKIEESVGFLNKWRTSYNDSKSRDKEEKR
ncbi:diadenylate cyclase CdaA [Peptoniphilus obesi]|uniref:diadenylate cyclase CdaA n=1 Tax=Peptoniphilus obesi TaxID=1472765 RepID=UPI0004B25C8F|nr:diadenylate cyclase CdaA [Peptoniphilus obesi]